MGKQREQALMTVDLVVLAANQVLLIKRADTPGKAFSGYWALPGGFVESGEEVEAALKREMLEELGLDLDTLSAYQLHLIDIFYRVGRDPRGRVLSFVHRIRINSVKAIQVKAGDDASDYEWFPLTALPPLAFDHAQIIERALKIV